MGFRQKIKGKIKRLIGLESEEKPVTAAPPAPSPRIETPLVQENPTPNEAPVPVQKAEESEKKEAVDADKVAKHLKRTRKGILKFIEKNGGTCGLAEMHDHSEKRFFVGHRKFSELMEGMVDEGLISYSWDTQEATITATGKEWMKQ